MPRVHPGQTTDNQLGKIAAAGFGIEPRRIVTETVSGSVAAVQRRGFTRLRPPRARRRAGGHRARPARPRRHGRGLHGGPTPPRTGSRRLVTDGPCSIAETVPTISTITRPIDGGCPVGFHYAGQTFPPKTSEEMIEVEARGSEGDLGRRKLIR